MTKDNSTDQTIKNYSHNYNQRGGMQNESGSGLGSKHSQDKAVDNSSTNSKAFAPRNGNQNG